MGSYWFVNYIILTDMSSEELEHILSIDLDQIDSRVNNKINNLQQITQTLTERSNFINSFQDLLRKQLQNMGKNKKNDQVCQHLITSISRKSIELDQNQSFYRQEPIIQRIDLNKREKAVFSNDLNQIYHKVNSIHLEFANLKEEIQYSVKQTKRVILNEAKQAMGKVIQLINNVYLSKLESLIQENEDLTEENQELHKKISNLSRSQIPKHKLLMKPSKIQIDELSFLQNNSNLHATQKLKQFFHSESYASNKDELTVNINYLNSTVNPKPNQKRPKIKQIDTTTNRQNPLYDSYCRPTSHYDLPALRSVLVNNPPCKDGFGILKLGTNVIYRGIWKNGVFNGRGNLIFEHFSYDGDFFEGKFQGFGTLKTTSLCFTGVFKENEACGEGTLSTRGQAICGVWRNNKLIRKF